MAYLFACVDSIEPISDSTIEQIGNISLYSYTSGATSSYNAGNMTKTIAAGTVIHNGATTTVAGNSVTLVSDPSNPRWTWTGIDSSGTAVIVSGDPAATPSVPELGDNVGLDLDLIQAGQTIAANIATQINKRVTTPPSGWKLVGSNTAEQTTTSATAADVVTVTTSSIPVTAPVMIVVVWRKSATAAQLSIGLKLNSTIVAEADVSSNTGIGLATTDNEVQSGTSVVIIGPRSTNYLRGLTVNYMISGATGIGSSVKGATVLTNAVPNAAITSVIIRGDSDGAATLGVKEVNVYQGV